MSKIDIGKKAPPFTLEGTGGNLVARRTPEGTAVVIYFYPRDNTPGCTQEGLDFAALNAQFKKAKARDVRHLRRTASRRTRNSRQKWPFRSNC